ncbi:hypothetical protein GCM10027277_51760 [Pseudoduganella ginsengisoli]
MPAAWSGHALVRYFALLNALYLLWLAGLKLTPSEAADTLRWWHGSTLWQALAGAVPDTLVLSGTMAAEVAAGACLLFYRRRSPLLWGAALASAIYAFNLLYMLTNPVWLQEMGGFPFLGSAQSAIKYVPMLGVSLYLLAAALPALSWLDKAARVLAWAGVVLVMGWIGAMKFFMFEAEAIEPLVRHHWVFAWMYGVWDVQGVSNVIGLMELLFAALAMLALPVRALAPLALAGIAVTVACTTSFMFTLPGWAAGAHFPLLNGSGVFLLKDQFLLAAMVLVARR